MNQTQRNYALSRIDEILSTKLSALKDKYTTPGKTLTREEKIALINSGKVKVTAFPHSYYGERYEFEVNFGNHEKADAFNKTKYNADAAVLVAKAKKAKDSIMLADNATAMAAIAEFEK